MCGGELKNLIWSGELGGGGVRSDEVMGGDRVEGDGYTSNSELFLEIMCLNVIYS